MIFTVSDVPEHQPIQEFATKHLGLPYSGEDKVLVTLDTSTYQDVLKVTVTTPGWSMGRILHEYTPKMAPCYTAYVIQELLEGIAEGLRDNASPPTASESFWQNTLGQCLARGFRRAKDLQPPSYDYTSLCDVFLAGKGKLLTAGGLNILAGAAPSDEYHDSLKALLHPGPGHPGAPKARLANILEHNYRSLSGYPGTPIADKVLRLLYEQPDTSYWLGQKKEFRELTANYPDYIKKHFSQVAPPYAETKPSFPSFTSKKPAISMDMPGHLSNVAPEITTHGGIAVAQTIKQLKQVLKKPGGKLAVWVGVQTPAGDSLGTYVETYKKCLMDSLALFPEDNLVSFFEADDGEFVFVRYLG